jgi:hypothetical protein
MKCDLAAPDVAYIAVCLQKPIATIILHAPGDPTMDFRAPLAHQQA